jgi:putative ABC transport system permease protein
MLSDTFAQTWRTLWAHKLRSFLTMFGIAWGVASLLLLVGLGEGFRSGNMREMEEFGKDLMNIYPGRAPVVEGRMNSARWYMLTYQDYLDITGASYVRSASPALARGDVRAVSEFASASGQITGVEPQFAQIRFLPLKEGRWLDELDGIQKRNVIVLGDEMAKNLFTGHPAVGSAVLLNGIRYQVIGTLKRVGRGDNNSTNMRSYVPFPAMCRDFPQTGENGRTALSWISYQPRTRAEHLLAQQAVHKIVAHNHAFDYHDENAFDGWDTIQESETIGLIFDAMDVFLGGVGMVTLVLGAIGVVNIMLVSVSERTREIGLRKALGATYRAILWQFLLEGTVLTLGSGLAGMAAAGGLMAAFHNVQGPRGFDPPRLVPMTAILAIASLTLAGVMAGLYPARQAARLQPVEALRQE